jgi:hypothetical protein
MEEGKIATAWHSLVRLKEVHQCIRMRATLSNTLLAWGRLDQFQPFGEPASRFTSAIERSGKWKKVR